MRLELLTIHRQQSVFTITQRSYAVVARYLGDREDRLEGEEYYSLIDEFMAAIKLRWPRALIQFEDFQSKHAVKLLARYF